MATPQDDSYSCPLDGVVAAGQYRFFSGGAELGSYDPATYLWTPGRDADGVITKASYDLLPKDGTWIEIAGTKFYDAISAQLAAALPGYNDPGNSDILDILDDYNGIALDLSGKRALAHGGGHQGGANNGICPLDLTKMAWSILKLPDMQTHWPANYNTNPPRDNSFTIYTRAKDAVDANPTTDAFYHDEFYDPVEPLANTRNPTARHTYQAMTFANGKLRHGVRRYWEYTEATDTWTSRFPLGKNATTHTQTGGGYCGEAVKGTWDEVNNRYLCTPTQINSVPGNGWAWNENTGTFSTLSGFVGGYDAYWAAACRMGRTWAFFVRPLSDNSAYWPPRLHLTDLDTDSTSTVNLTGIEQSKCIHSSKFDESSTMEYVAANGKIFCLMPYDAADAYSATANLPLEQFWIDRVSGTIQHEAKLGAFPVLNSVSLLKNKLFYVPAIKALVMIPYASSNIRIRRFQ